LRPIEGDAVERRHCAAIGAAESLLDIGETNDTWMFAHRRAPGRTASFIWV
jgi:hypothetical protein